MGYCSYTYYGQRDEVVELWLAILTLPLPLTLTLILTLPPTLPLTAMGAYPYPSGPTPINRGLSQIPEKQTQEYGPYPNQRPTTTQYFTAQRRKLHIVTHGIPQ